jgi:hypothetical protein
MDRDIIIFLLASPICLLVAGWVTIRYKILPSPLRRMPKIAKTRIGIIYSKIIIMINPDIFDSGCPMASVRALYMSTIRAKKIDILKPSPSNPSHGVHKT